MSKAVFIGVGRMARGLIESFSREGGIDGCSILGTHHDPMRCEALQEELGIPMVASNREAIEGARYIFLCVRPLQLLDTVTEIGNLLTKEQTVISIAVGVPLIRIRARCPKAGPIFHVHPPSLCMAHTRGMSFVAHEARASTEAVKHVEKIFAKLGSVRTTAEENIDRFAVFAGASPAFVCQILDDWHSLALDEGIEKEVADEIIHYIVRGIYTAYDGYDPRNGDRFSLEQIIHRIATPNGVTRVGLRAMERRKYRNFKGALKSVASQCLKKIAHIRDAVGRQ